jgi:hypothetical protein
VLVLMLVSINGIGVKDGPQCVQPSMRLRLKTREPQQINLSAYHSGLYSTLKLLQFAVYLIKFG